jgi:hypothetical protein
VGRALEAIEVQVTSAAPHFGRIIASSQRHVLLPRDRISQRVAAKCSKSSS